MVVPKPLQLCALVVLFECRGLGRTKRRLETAMIGHVMSKRTDYLRTIFDGGSVEYRLVKRLRNERRFGLVSQSL